MKKIQFLKIACVSLILISMSCKKAEEAPVEASKPAFDLATAKTEIEARHRAFEKAFNEKDSVALADCYAIDAKFMNPNDKSVEGRPVIVQASSAVRIFSSPHSSTRFSLIFGVSPLNHCPNVF